MNPDTITAPEDFDTARRKKALLTDPPREPSRNMKRDAERSVLTCLFAAPDRAAEFLATLNDEPGFADPHAAILDAARKAHASGCAMKADTVSQFLDPARCDVATLTDVATAKCNAKNFDAFLDLLRSANGTARKRRKPKTSAFGDDAWPTPKPLPDDLPSVQPFNFDCLPDTLRPWLEDISERMQCPPDYPAVGREDSRAFFLEAWNGTGDFTCDRIGRGTVRIEAVTVSILGAIQPGPLSDYLRQAVRSGVGDDGLLQRFQLAVWPDTSKDWRNVDRWPDTKAKNDAFAVFQYLDALSAAAVGADSTDGIPFLRFTPGAQERFDLWRAELERILRSDCDHPAFEAHLAKYRKLVPALALVLHLANRDTGPVTLAALEKALVWANYLESHARRIYSAVLRPDVAAGRELAKHLQRGELADKFTLRETYRKGWTGLASKEDAEAATEILCDLGWIRAVHGTGPANGRPASPSFEVHPKICEHTATATAKADTTPPSEVLAVASVALAPCVENSSASEAEPGLAADLL